MCKPNFLPNILNLNGSWEHILNKLYSIFVKDIKKSKLTLNHLPVIYNSKILPDGKNKEEGFWHLISRENRRTKERLPDYRRAERLHWIKPLIEHINDKDVICFEYDEGSKDKGIRIYIWQRKMDFLVILGKKKNKYILITSFYITSKVFREDIERKYKNRIKYNDRP